MDNVAVGNDIINQDLTLDADLETNLNSVEVDSIGEVDSQIVDEDSSTANSKASKEGKRLADSNSENGTLTDLMNEINSCTGNEYKLSKNYVFDVINDDYMMPINKNNFTIDGQGHTINGQELCNLLFINGTNITLKNINFIHGSAYPLYGMPNFIESVFINGSGTVKNCTFKNGIIVAALGFADFGSVDNCSFIDNLGEMKGGGIYFRNGGVVNHSSFINNFAPYGGAIYTAGDLFIENIYAQSNYAHDGSHIFFAEDGANVTIRNVTPTYALGAGFTELNNLIKSGQNIVLTKDYMYVSRSDNVRGKPVYLNGIEITKDNMVIDGAGHAISGEGLVRIFKITANNVTLKNINFFNGYSEGNGGAVYLEGRKYRMTIENCNFTNNFAKGNGGAVFGNATIKNSIFTNSTSEANGGAFWAMIGEVRDCVFSNNTAKNGGGIYAYELTCVNSILEDNKAEECAGGFYAIRDSVEGCKFFKNAAGYGGAFYSDEIGSFRNCVFSFNSARNDGGAGLFDHFGPNTNLVDNCTFNNNSAIGNGGAIYSSHCLFKAVNSKFSFNQANDGGALYLKNGGEADHVEFEGNNAENEGDAIFSDKDLDFKNIVYDNGSDDSNLVVIKK